MEPFGDGEDIGFRNPDVVKVSDQRELNFVLAPFLSRQVHKSTKVSAAELLRKALIGSTANSGYALMLDQLKIRSVAMHGDDLVVGANGDIGVK